MRDGIKLSANIFLPEEEGAYPTVFQRVPYGASGYPDGAFWVEHGYAYLTEDCRGRYDSEGEFYPFAADAEDGGGQPGLDQGPAVVRRAHRHVWTQLLGRRAMVAWRRVGIPT